MKNSHPYFFWFIVIMYFTTFFSSAYSVFFNKKFLAKIAVWALRIGFILNFSVFLMDFFHYGNFPLNRANLVAILFIICLQIVRKKEFEHIVFISMIPIIAALFLEGQRNPANTQLASNDSSWLVMHVIFAWFTFASFAVATALSVMYLVKHYKQGAFTGYSLDELDKNTYKLVGIGLFFQFGMMAAGMMWAKQIYGRYWGWDPVEVWSLIIMIYYTIYLHGRLLLRIPKKAASWLIVAGLILFMFSIWGLKLIVPIDHLSDPEKSLTK